MYKYLSKTADFEILKEKLSEEILEYLEEEIRYYEEESTDGIIVDDLGIHEDKDYEPSFVIAWYEGLVTTEELIDVNK